MTHECEFHPLPAWQQAFVVWLEPALCCCCPVAGTLSVLLLSPDAAPQLDAIHTAVESHLAHANGLRLLFSRRYLPQLAMSTIIPAAQQLTGINAIM